MKFSIRTLLILTAVISLAVLTFSKTHQLRRDTALLAMKKAETEALTVELKATQVEHKESEAIKADRDAAVEQFTVLLKKYTTLESRDPGTFSIRSVPQLRSGDELPPSVFRLRVPEERPVWLKWGIVDSGSLSAYKTMPFVNDPAMEHPGPYAIQLPPGDHILKFTKERASLGRLPFKLEVNEQILIETAYVSDEKLDGGMGSVSAREQIDYKPERELAGIISAKIKDLEIEAEKELAVIIGFDDEGGEEFLPFPGLE